MNCDQLTTDERENLPKALSVLAWVVASLLIFAFSFISSCETATAAEYTDTEIVNAIYLAEGGKKASFPYGIRSVKCTGEIECRKICERTVRNNRKRYADYGHRRFDSFIEFLASRYCPSRGQALSSAERRLNVNWLKNVIFFLEKGGV